MLNIFSTVLYAISIATKMKYDKKSFYTHVYFIHNEHVLVIMRVSRTYYLEFQMLTL